MRISDWSSDVCSSDLAGLLLPASGLLACSTPSDAAGEPAKSPTGQDELTRYQDVTHYNNFYEFGTGKADPARRSEEHTSELQSLMRISYAVFCLKKKNTFIKFLSILHVWLTNINTNIVSQATSDKHTKPTLNGTFI